LTARLPEDSGSRFFTEPAGQDEVFLSIGEDIWFEGFFMPDEDPSYIASLQLFAIGLPNSGCRFSGEVRMIELPELEVLDRGS
jgi:hypothetical protein